ncbi:MAG: hypothetical protein JWM93_1802, partial [Frankiales bacterium]|nr:hypothetical protein [Frankiales bacterium]
RLPRRARLVPAAVGALLGATAVAAGILAGKADPSTALVICVAAIFVLAAGGTGGGRETRFDWLGPVAVRAGEYGFLLWLGSTTAHGLPAAYALLSVLAFHHYDTVYRLRHLHAAPPRRLRAAGGWDGRVLVAAIVYAVDAIRPVYLVSAGVLGVAFVAESVHAWVTASRPAPAATTGGRPE